MDSTTGNEMGTTASRSSNRPGNSAAVTSPPNPTWVSSITTSSLRTFDAGRRGPRSTVEPRSSIATPPEPNKPQLKVLKVDLKASTNKHLHKTFEIDEVKGLIVRRGQAFNIAVELDRPFNKSNDSISLDFQTGKDKSLRKPTRLLVSLGETHQEMAGGWTAEVDEQKENMLEISVTASPHALVGKYSLAVRTKVKSEDSSTEPKPFIYNEPSPIFILFNAWCETDQVYLENSEELDEYVMNEQGFIWYGSTRQLARRPWNFSQFEKTVFEAVMNLLEKHVYSLARGNPIAVSRVMSAAVNSQDDNGVLTGRWDGNYKPHTKPTQWTGSQRILEEHVKTKAPVKYGQCWVFSGLLTTVLRCLGIPSRSVTNFASAHDTDASLTIERFYDKNYDRLSEYESDSVWNFHVWNEAWMSRPDLPAGYGGWQAVDSTPQETSDGIYCTGPAPVCAIKQGHVYYPYDALFIFAEVNGDIVNWMVVDDEKTNLINIKKKSVGKSISTKAVGSNERHDLTNEYKHPEDSAAERAAVVSASEHGSKPFFYDKIPGAEDVDMSIVAPDLHVGADFSIKVPLVNKSSEDREVSVTVIVRAVYYTGVLADKLVKVSKTFQLGPNVSDEMIVRIDADQYMDKLVEQSALKVFLLGHVEETGQAFAIEEDVRLRTPDMSVEVVQPEEDKIQIGSEVIVELKLTNPLKKTLTNCELTVEGPGLVSPIVSKHGNVPAGDTFSHKVKFKPRKAGKKTLVATFESDQLSQVTGELPFTVKWPE